LAVGASVRQAVQDISSSEKAAIGVLVPVGVVIMGAVLFLTYKKKRDDEVAALRRLHTPTLA